MSDYKLEICSNSVQSALNAQEGGADRVELCDNLWESGTTPSYASLKLARKLLDIGLFVLVRPRGGDFVYSDLEFEVMKEDIAIAKTIGADGIVSGVLQPDNSLDFARTAELIACSQPLPFTFHRAFDLIENYSQALEQLVELGANRVLTSGRADDALSGLPVIKELNQQAQGRIIIMPGGGINSDNIQQLTDIGCREFHLSGKEKLSSPAAEPTHRVRLNESADIPERDYFETRVEKVRSAKDKLLGLNRE